MSDVLIAGAGPAGLAAAAGFARAGRKVRVVDPAPAAPPARGRLYALNRPALQLLADIAPAALAQANAVSAMRVFAPGGRLLDFTAASARMPALAATVGEEDLLAALRAAAADAGAQIAYGTRIDALRTRANGLTAQCGDASLEARLLIAADGARSATAALAGVHARPAGPAQAACAGWLQASAAEPAVAWQWFEDDAILALLPAGLGRFCYIWSAPERGDAADDAHLRERISAISRAEVGACSFEGPAVRFAVRPSLASASHGRIALIGDCARAIYPLAGQGLALAFGDAAELLECCSAQADPGCAAALGRYRRRRRLRNAATVSLTGWLAASAAGARAPARALDAAALAAPECMLGLAARLANAR